jgi:mannose-6-phosphate isomerase
VTVTDQQIPFVLEPTLAPAIWGGDALVKSYGKSGDPGAALGESWECWDANRVAGGTFAGKTLGELRAQLGPELMGPLDASAIFPILTKIIDARQALSVQVHPDDAYAQRVEHQSNGKAECWYILAAEPGAELVLGWTRDTDRAEYERRVADGTLGEILRRVPVAAGDVFNLPAGTLHAIGAGIQLFEVQQASDLTYRIFDWNRVGADGKPRQLHVEKAGDVLDYRASTNSAIPPLSFDQGALKRTLLVADKRFLVERIAVRDGGMLATDGVPLALMALDPMHIVQHGVVLDVAPYQTVIVPAAATTIAFNVGGEALVARPQPNLAQVKQSALAGGATRALVDAFFGAFE